MVEVQIAIGLLVSFMYAIMLAAFVGVHFFMILKNKGTLDSLVPMFKKQNNIYDLGRKSNFTQVFGDDPIFWFLPVFTTKGDGYSFPTNNVNNQEDSIAI